MYYNGSFQKRSIPPSHRAFLPSREGEKRNALTCPKRREDMPMQVCPRGYTFTGWKIKFALTLALGAKMQMPWMQHICYSANSCANFIDNLKRIYSPFENNFVMPWLKGKITSSVVKYRTISERISFNRLCLKHLHMNSHYSKCVAFTAFAFTSANMIFHPVFVKSY